MNADYLNALHDAKALSRSSRRLVWWCALFVVAFLVWAAWTQVDELVRGSGKVIPSSQLQVVQNLEGGIVSEILVAEGDYVEPGQVLLRMDATQFDSSFNEQRLRVAELEAKVLRLRAEVAGKVMAKSAPKDASAELKSFYLEERSLFAQRKAQLASAERVVRQQIEQKRQGLSQAQAKLKQSRKALALAQKELDILTPLFKDGVVSEVELLRAQKAHLNVQGDISRFSFEIPEYQAAMQELQSKLDSKALTFRSEAQQALNQVLAELPRLSQSSGALEDRVLRTALRSPVRGTVKQLMINTVGGVVQPGMDVVSIVPVEDSLLIETQIKPADIARLYPGQAARVRFSAYDFSIYGSLDAKLVHISADTLVGPKGEAYYLVRVKTALNKIQGAGEDLPIIPGMVAEVDILTGKKTVLDYLLKPVFKAQRSALTEP